MKQIQICDSCRDGDHYNCDGAKAMPFECDCPVCGSYWHELTELNTDNLY